LSEQATNNVALIFHEFATNAAKHGALKENGSISVQWSIDAGKVIIDWQESGGPKVNTPIRNGFGSTLVRSTVQSLKGEISYDWRPSGVRILMTIPAVL
jgi:two-component sensor histidine kinase